VNTVLLAVAGVGLVGWLALAVVLLWRRRPRERPIVRPAAENGQLRRLDHELRAARDFVQLLPEVLGELRVLGEVRAVPPALLQIMVRTFGADDALVAIRRQPTLAEPDRERRLVVAATSGSALPLGTEITDGEGHVGLVAQRELGLSREQYLQLATAAAMSRSPVFDAAAPMVIDGQTIGVLAFARPTRHHRLELEMLQAIAQLGALTWYRVQSLRSAQVTAVQDGLTGLFNKRAISERLGEEVHRARTSRERLSIFLFDIDHFKHFNDTNGHLAGDQVLRTLARLAAESLRSDGPLGRFGGEEFLLLLPGQAQAQALVVADRLRRRIAGHPFDHGRRQPGGRLTISGGVACFPDDADEAAGLLQAADTALYRAKAAGRDRVVGADTRLSGGG
jgi:diguanylate cyclase (GGDEF)-like protein